jgi:hypothetical protein
MPTEIAPYSKVWRCSPTLRQSMIHPSRGVKVRVPDWHRAPTEDGSTTVLHPFAPAIPAPDNQPLGHFPN